VRGILIILAIVLVLVAVGYGLAELIALPFGGVGTLGGIFIGLLIVMVALGVLTLVGRRRQAKALAARASARGG